MEIQIGKSYRNRGNGITKIVDYSYLRPDFPFKDELGFTYTKNGKYRINKIDLLDLVEEIVKQDSSTKTNLLYGDTYYVPYLDSPCNDLVKQYEWRNDFTDKLRLERGIVFLTKQDARETANKLLKILEII